MSNPFAALFEDVDQASDPMLAEAQLSDVMFAPLPPIDGEAPSAAPQVPATVPASAAPVPSSGPVRETIAPIKRSRSVAMSGGKAIQQALIITLEKRSEPNLDELNDLLASGWRVARAEAFHPMDSGGRTSMLVVVEQEAPK
ncbi:MAG: hypothetical protein AAF791_14370 [Bacteroidota bacterium]